MHPLLQSIIEATIVTVVICPLAMLAGAWVCRKIGIPSALGNRKE